MSGQPLFSDLSGNPRDARVRMAPQATLASITGGGAHVPIAAAASFTQAQVFGGGPARTRGEIVDQVLAPAGAPLDGLAGKWGGNSGTMAFGTIDPGNPLQLMAWANMLGHYSYTSPFGTGVGYVVNNSPGPYAIGTTTIAVDGGALGTVLAGDVVMWAGDTNKYTVASATAGTTVTSVTLVAPGLLATLADGVAMTISAYRVWRFGLTEATEVVPWLTCQWNDQVTTPLNMAGLIFHGFGTSATPNSPYAMTAGYGFHAWSEFGDTTQTVGSGSTLPTLIGTFDGNMAAEATDDDIYIKIVDASAKTLAAKESAATSYPGAVQTYVLGTPLRLRNQTGARIGAPSEQVMAYFPTGATLTTNDVFKIVRRRAPWVESLPTRRPISSVNCSFLVDGEAIAIPGGWNTVNGWDGVYNVQDTPGAQGAIIQNDGAFVSTITPTRRITDLLFQKGIRTGSYVAVVIDAISSVLIGNTLREYRVLIVYPRCLVTGAMHATDAGGVNKNESPILIAKDPTTPLTYDGYTFSDPMTVLVETDVTNITALVAA